MAQFQRPNPWQPGYALPNYVYGEPPGRGTLTTKGLPRGTIDTADAHKTQANYAVPGYVLAETQGRGVYDTDMLPRRWVDTLAPDDLARPYPPTRGSLSGTVFSKKTLSGSSLGDVRRYAPNPFDQYGEKAVRQIEQGILQNPDLSPDQKKAALKRALDQIDPKLQQRIVERAEQLRLRGVPPGPAFRRAMAVELSSGLSQAVQTLGRRGRGGSRGLSGTARLFGSRLRGSTIGGAGVLGLGATSTSTPEKITIDVAGIRLDVTRYADGKMEGSKRFTSPGGFQGLKLPLELDRAFRSAYNHWTRIDASPFAGGGGTVFRTRLSTGKIPVMKFGSPTHGVFVTLDTGAFNDKIRSAVVSVKYVPPPDKNLLEKGMDLLSSVVTAPFKIVGVTVSKVADVAGDVVKKLGSVACDVVGSDAAVVAAGVTGGYHGGEAGAQAGVAGTQIAQSICGKSPPAPPLSPSKPFPIVPIALAAGGVVLVVLAVKRG